MYVWLQDQIQAVMKVIKVPNQEIQGIFHQVLRCHPHSEASAHGLGYSFSMVSDTLGTDTFLETSCFFHAKPKV